MRGMLGLSMTPLASAVRLAGTASTKYIERYFRTNNGVGDQIDLLNEIIIPANVDFEIEFSISLFGVGTGTFFGGELENKNTLVADINTNKIRIFSYDSQGTITTLLQSTVEQADNFADTKIRTVGFKYINGVSTLLLDGITIDTSNWDLVDGVSINQFLSRTKNGFRRLNCIPAEFKLWRNGDRTTGELTDWYEFSDPNSVYQRNHAVAQGVELYSDSFALPEFFSRDGNIITKTDTTSETIFIANVEAGKHYKLSFRKDSHSSGSPNFRDQFNNQYIFPLMSPLESSGRTYEFVFTATTDGRVGINGASSLWSVSELSIKEFRGCEITGGMPEDWVKYKKKFDWLYWLNEENLFTPTSHDENTWDYDGISKYTKNSDSWGQLGENFGEVDSKMYVQISMNYFGSGLRTYTRRADNTGNQFNIIPDTNGHITYETYIPYGGIWFDSNIAVGASISDIKINKKLEIAQ